jgi:hypothetical protein
VEIIPSQVSAAGAIERDAETGPWLAWQVLWVDAWPGSQGTDAAIPGGMRWVGVRAPWMQSFNRVLPSIHELKRFLVLDDFRKTERGG